MITYDTDYALSSVMPSHTSFDPDNRERELVYEDVQVAVDISENPTVRVSGEYLTDLIEKIVLGEFVLYDDDTVVEGSTAPTLYDRVTIVERINTDGVQSVSIKIWGP